MTKALFILLIAGALAGGVTSSHDQPPLLIDSAPAPAAVDANG